MKSDSSCYELRRLLKISWTKFKISKVIVLGGLFGRFDHVLSSLHSLLRFDSCEIAIIDGVNLVTILREVQKLYSQFINYAQEIEFVISFLVISVLCDIGICLPDFRVLRA